MDDWVRVYRHELDAEGVDPRRAARGDETAGRRRRRRTSWQLLERYPRRDVAGAARAAAVSADERRGRRHAACSPASSTWRIRASSAGEGVWLHTTDGRRILDACSGGAMVTCLGPRRPRDRRRRGRAGRADRLLLQPPLHERAAGAARRPPDRGRGARDGARPVRLGRLRGQRDGAAPGPAVPRRSRRGRALAGDLAGAGLPRLDDGHARRSPAADAPGALRRLPRRRTCTSRRRPGGSTRPAQAALEELDRAARGGRPGDGRRVLLRAGQRGRAARLLAARALLARTGGAARASTASSSASTRSSPAWAESAAGSPHHQLPIEPDIVTIGKGLGAGLRAARRGAMQAARVRRHRPRARASSTSATPGTARRCRARSASPSSTCSSSGACRAGARARARACATSCEAALAGSEIVREVRGRGFLLGVELVDPRDGESFLPDELDAAALVDDTAFEHGVLVDLHPLAQPDGYAGDQTLLAPAYTSTDEELAEMVDRFAATIDDVEREIKRAARVRRPARTMTEVEASVDESAEAPIGDASSSCSGSPTSTARSEARRCGRRHSSPPLRNGDGDDRPLLGARPGRHADHRLRAVRDPHRRRRPDRASRPGHAARAHAGGRAGASASATPSWPDGSACELASREVFRSALDGMRELGYEVMAALEYEIRLRDADGSPLSSGISYSLAEIGRYERVRRRARPGARRARDRAVRRAHRGRARAARAQPRARAGALQAADDAAFMKFAVKEVAASMGLRASFLAKTDAGRRGLERPRPPVVAGADDDNAFAAQDRRRLLPTPLASAIAGVLEHLPAASLLLNPTINSYKRLVPGWFAPDQRQLGVREPLVRRAGDPLRPGRSSGGSSAAGPGADANPYLALAALAASAADGIRRGATPPRAVDGRRVRAVRPAALPGSSRRRCEASRPTRSLRRALGETFSEYFATSRALGAEGVARDGHRLGTRALRSGRLARGETRDEPLPTPGRGGGLPPCERPGSALARRRIRGARSIPGRLRRAGARTAILAPGEDGEPEELLEPFDGLVLVGGGDVHPSTYGRARRTDHIYGVEPDRDAFEIGLRARRRPAACSHTLHLPGDADPERRVRRHASPAPSGHGRPDPARRAAREHRVPPCRDPPRPAPCCPPHEIGPAHVLVASPPGVDRVGEGLTARAQPRRAWSKRSRCRPRHGHGGRCPRPRSRGCSGVQWHPEETATTDPAQQIPVRRRDLIARLRASRAPSRRESWAEPDYAIADPDPAWAPSGSTPRPPASATRSPLDSVAGSTTSAQRPCRASRQSRSSTSNYHSWRWRREPPTWNHSWPWATTGPWIRGRTPASTSAVTKTSRRVLHIHACDVGRRLGGAASRLPRRLAV